jgi:hypothetical protein
MSKAKMTKLLANTQKGDYSFIKTPSDYLELLGYHQDLLEDLGQLRRGLDVLIEGVTDEKQKAPLRTFSRFILEKTEELEDVLVRLRNHSLSSVLFSDERDYAEPPLTHTTTEGGLMMTSERLESALKNLMEFQGQLDKEGIFVSVSREALDIVIEHIKDNNGWMPIETAPYDENILVFTGDGIFEAYRASNKRFKATSPRDGGDYLLSVGIEPTDWRPLPQPPKEK